MQPSRRLKYESNIMELILFLIVMAKIYVKKEWEKGTNQGKLLGLGSEQLVSDGAFYREKNGFGPQKTRVLFSGFLSLGMVWVA